MTPFAGFLIGVGVMSLSIACAVYVALRWLEEPEHALHLVSSFCRGLSDRHPRLRVPDSDGSMRELFTLDVAVAIERLPAESARSDPSRLPN